MYHAITKNSYANPFVHSPEIHQADGERETKNQLMQRQTTLYQLGR